MGYNFLEYLENNVENIEKDFDEFLKENEIDFLPFDVEEIEKNINLYLSAIYYELEDNTDTQEELNNAEDFIYGILDNYCCQLPF